MTTFARACPVSLSRKPLSPGIKATPKTDLSLSRSLLHRQTWRLTSCIEHYLLISGGQSVCSVQLVREELVENKRSENAADRPRHPRDDPAPPTDQHQLLRLPIACSDTVKNLGVWLDRNPIICAQSNYLRGRDDQKIKKFENQRSDMYQDRIWT